MLWYWPTFKKCPQIIAREKISHQRFCVFPEFCVQEFLIYSRQLPAQMTQQRELDQNLGCFSDWIGLFVARLDSFILLPD
jgi:hypothetical protein